MSLRKTSPVVALTATLFLLAGCGDDDEGVATDTARPSAPSSATASPSVTAASEHNDADVEFAQEMIVHHRGALAMAELGEDKAESSDVRALAKRIRAAQEAEVQTLRSWLSEWGEAIPTPSPSTTSAAPASDSMDHDTMAGASARSVSPSPTGSPAPGMSGMNMSDMDLTELQAADGSNFDRMFLTMMIEHHRDALDMARVEQDEGLYREAIALAEEIERVQQEEIAEMEDLLAEL